MIERRRAPRIETNLKLPEGPSGPGTSSRISDISSTGVFIESSAPLPVNAELDLNLQLPDNPTTMSAHARVVWIKSSGSNAAVGMGMQFTNLLPEQQKILDNFIEHNLQLGHGKILGIQYV